MRQTRVISLAAVSFLVAAPAWADQPALYGGDDRLEARQAPAAFSRAVRATAVVATIAEVDERGETARLLAEPFLFVDSERRRPLCPDARFHGQPSIGGCTAFLVASDIAATAGHCVRMWGCGGLRLVFDYLTDEAGAAPSSVDAKNVFRCLRIEARASGAPGAPDWALLRLDRPAEGREPLPLAERTPPRGTSLVAFGHVAGVPLKFGRGRVRRTYRSGFFDATLAAFPGCSGGPVLDERSGAVVGLMSNGEGLGDYAQTPGRCWRPADYGPDGGVGTGVTGVGELAVRLRALSGSR